MRVFVIGSGGREHALVWKLRQSPSVSHILAAPGNGGIEAEGVALASVAADRIPELVDLARRERMDLVVPGPELPLTLGIVDAMTEAGIACFGPDRHCARLEGSKAFAKAVMAEAGVPTAHGAAFTEYAAAVAYARAKGAPLVVKADGLAAGKGVAVAMTEAEVMEALDAIMRRRVHGEAGGAVVIEEFLEGEEASFLCFCDGEHAVPLPSAQDHKAVFDGDAGPNTGGMGAYSPAPVLPDSEAEAMADLVIRPVLRALAQAGHPFKGVLYAGLMMTAHGPKVLEYNTRFGDPECQPLLMRLETDVAQVMLACVQGRLSSVPLVCSDQAALGVVLAAQGYPGDYPKGMEIHGIDEADAMPGVKIFHSGTRLDKGRVLACGGRVLCVTAMRPDLEDARRAAYAAVARIRMDDCLFRTDIGLKGVRRLQQS